MKKIQEIFSVDLRTLAFFRMSLAAVLFYDLCWRAVDLCAHYTDQGIIPRAVLLASPYYRQFWSAYFIDGGTNFTIFLFLVNAVALIVLFLGYRTRLMTFVCWFLLVSLHNRNPLVLTGGDTILRLLLFWSMFLPLGAVWSADASASKGPVPSYKFFSIGTVALYLQFLMIYFFAWASKTGTQWWPEGAAVYYALSIEYMTTHWGSLLLHAPGWLLKTLTYGVYWFECSVPLLFFIKRFRMILVILLMAMHTGFALALELGIFPLGGVLTAIILVPGYFWDKSFLKQRMERWAAFLSKMTGQWAHSSAEDCFVLNTIEKGFVIICLIAAVSFNVEGMQKFPPFLPQAARQFIYTVRINQSWAMFSPQPSQTTGWYVLEAGEKDGAKIDLASGGRAVSYEKPADVSLLYGNCRWRKFQNNIGRREFARYRKFYADYLCRTWNARHTKDPVENLSIIYFEQRNFDDYIRSNSKPVVLLDNYQIRENQ